MTRSIASQVRVVDMSGDGFADRFYAADMGGQILRIDIKNGQAPGSLGAGGVIAQLGAEGDPTQDFAVTRRFFNSPDVSIFEDRLENKRFISINIGSGYRALPLDTTPADTYFSLRDADIFSQLTQAQYDSYPIVYESEMVEVAGQVNTAIAAAKNPVLMASAMRKAIEAGREAYLAGRMAPKRFASASSPLEGLFF